jgi:MYXO-CTERM domain-containing protein
MLGPSFFARALSAVVALATVSSLATSASAFCRSTTCTGDCPRDENGCKTTGKAIAWPGLCVGFSIQKDLTFDLPGAKVREAIQDGFAAWSDLDCGGGQASIAFTELADVACHRTEYAADGANANIILFQDTKWVYHGPNDTLAKTTVTFDHDTGEILDADIEVNHAYNELTVGDDNVVYDLRSIMTHEIGHFIGLDHTPDTEATMFAGYDEGETKQRTLEADDVAGACAIYPAGRVGKCDPKPRGGLGNECGGAAASTDGGAAPEKSGCATEGAPAEGAGWLAMIALAAAAARRRR